MIYDDVIRLTNNPIVMRTIIDLTNVQLELLAQFSADEKISRAELIRRAITEYLQRNAKPVEDKAFGLWAQRHKDGLKYQECLRAEWD